MANSSTFISRNLFSRVLEPTLPLYNKPLRHKPSEYSLDELSPRPDDALLSREDDTDPQSSTMSARRSPSPPMSLGSQGSASKRGMKKTRFLFTGPPPPIATSVLLRPEPASRARRDSNTAEHENHDTVWRALRRREKGMHKDIQAFLDAQVAGLNLSSAAADAASTTDVSTPRTSGSRTPTTADPHPGTNSRRLGLASTRLLDKTATRTTASGAVIPVRQPRARPVGLRTARAGIGRSMAALSDLKAEEDALVSDAVATRKKALANLRLLSSKRANAEAELKLLEEDEEEPLAAELEDLGKEREEISKEIKELEARLVGLRQRRRYLDGRMNDVRNRREAGLSGYRGALRELDGEVEIVLRRPPVQPLDLVALGIPRGTETPGGTEFLSLRPERRTVDMAREWWENDIALLERRKDVIDRERAALDEGAEVWRETLSLVTEFETGLRNQVNGVPMVPAGKGKDRVPTPEEAMVAQLQKMRDVIDALQEKLEICEDQQWNLLICAIGAEIEAFKEGEEVLSQTLKVAGIEVEERSYLPSNPVSLDSTAKQRNGNGIGTQLVDIPGPSTELQQGHISESQESDDNEVPPDLLVSSGHKVRGYEARRASMEWHDSLNHVQGETSPRRVPPQRQDSVDDASTDNEIPPEFLAEHVPGQDVVGEIDTQRARQVPF